MGSKSPLSRAILAPDHHYQTRSRSLQGGVLRRRSEVIKVRVVSS